MKLNVNAFVTELSVRRENKLGRETETDEEKDSTRIQREQARQKPDRQRGHAAIDALPDGRASDTLITARHLD